jgi:hypothetical protein
MKTTILLVLVSALLPLAPSPATDFTSTTLIYTSTGDVLEYTPGFGVIVREPVRVTRTTRVKTVTRRVADAKTVVPLERASVRPVTPADRTTIRAIDEPTVPPMVEIEP